MPIRRRFSIVRNSDFEELTESQRNVLLYGHCLLREQPFATKEELLAAWQLHSRELLSEFIVTHPGSRPFAWWLCEHGSERPILNHHPDDAAFIAHYRAEINSFGFLDTSIGIPRNGSLVPWQEPQHVYLRRNNLLTPDELHRPDLEGEAI